MIEIKSLREKRKERRNKRVIDLYLTMTGKKTNIAAAIVKKMNHKISLMTAYRIITDYENGKRNENGNDQGQIGHVPVPSAKTG